LAVQMLGKSSLAGWLAELAIFVVVLKSVEH
jgi:hypothetical protein